MTQPFYTSPAINRNGNYRNNEKLLKNIKQFPTPEFFDSNINNIDDAANNWIFAQRKIK